MTYQPPRLEIPLSDESRRQVLMTAHKRFLETDAEVWAITSPAFELLPVVIEHIAAPLVASFMLELEHRHAEWLRAWTPVGGGPIGELRNAWVGTMVAQIFGKVEGPPIGWGLDAFFDFESIPGRRQVWDPANRSPFAEHMAREAVRATVEPFIGNRKPGQTLSYFGITAPDIAGITVPGYVPPERVTIVVPIKTRPIVSKYAIDFLVELALVA